MAVAHSPYYTFYSIHLVDHGYSKGLTGWLWAIGVVCEIAIFLWLPRLYAAYTLRPKIHKLLPAFFEATKIFSRLNNLTTIPQPRRDTVDGDV